MAYALFIALLMVLIAGSIGMYIRHKIWGIANKPKTAFEYGRAWAAYIAFFVPMASINRFIDKGVVEGFFSFLVLIIFYPLIAFVIGFFWGLIATSGNSSKNENQTESSSNASATRVADSISNSNLGFDTQHNVLKEIPIHKISKNKNSNIDISGTDEWNLAIKYDDGLRTDYQKLLSINEELAKEFQNEILFKKLIANYKVLFERYMKKAIGLQPGEEQYSKNELINEIVIVVSKQAPEIAKEILELVRIYRFEEVADYAELAAKLFPLLEKIEEVNQISITKNLKKFALSNELLIKYGMYKKFIDIDVECLELASGAVAVVRDNEYRVYADKSSAKFAVASFKNMSNWTLKNLVEKIDRAAC